MRFTRNSTVRAVAAGAWVAIGALTASAEVREGFATSSDGVRIHSVDVGSGTALVFVPGWTVPAEIWEPQLRHFGRSHRAVALDPRCQGASSQTADGLDSATRARDIRAVVSHLRLTSIVLVAWSQGVTEAIAYVHQFGTKDLAGLVLVDGVAGGEFDPATIGHMEREKMPNARLVTIEGAGHAVFVDAPDTFNRLVEEFAESVAPYVR